MIPDITGLTSEELVQLLQEVNVALQQQQQTEEQVRETLLDPAVVQGQIDNLLAQIDNMQAVLDTPNAEIKTDPQTHVKAIARAQRRTINNVIRTLRVLSGELGSAEVGE